MYILEMLERNLVGSLVLIALPILKLALNLSPSPSNLLNPVSILVLLELSVLLVAFFWKGLFTRKRLWMRIFLFGSIWLVLGVRFYNARPVESGVVRWIMMAYSVIPLFVLNGLLYFGLCFNTGWLAELTHPFLDGNKKKYNWFGAVMCVLSLLRYHTEMLLAAGQAIHLNFESNPGYDAGKLVTLVLLNLVWVGAGVSVLLAGRALVTAKYWSHWWYSVFLLTPLLAVPCGDLGFDGYINNRLNESHLKYFKIQYFKVVVGAIAWASFTWHASWIGMLFKTVIKEEEPDTSHSNKV